MSDSVYNSEKTSKEYYSIYEEHGKNYDSTQHVWRPTYEVILNWINENSRVLDLGCGEGSLGLLLKRRRCEVHGIDVDKNGVRKAVEKGVKAVVSDIDAGLDYRDKYFEYVIINETLHMVYRPKYVLGEALRVGKKVIVSFPNFAFFYSRFELLVKGIFPKSTLFGYEWYNTKHIHLFSYTDFLGLVKNLGAEIEKKEFQHFERHKTLKKIYPSFLSKIFPNIFSRICIVMITKN